MAEDLVVSHAIFRMQMINANIKQELGFEGFDRLVDKHYDTAHDHAIQYGRKIPRPKRWRKNAHGDNVLVEEPQRASSETRNEPSRESYRRHGENNSSEDEDQDYASERPRQRPRRYSGNESRGEAASNLQHRKVSDSKYQEVHFASVNFDLS